MLHPTARCRVTLELFAQTLVITSSSGLRSARQRERCGQKKFSDPDKEWKKDREHEVCRHGQGHGSCKPRLVRREIKRDKRQNLFQHLQKACGRMAKSAKCCSPRPPRRFAKCTIGQWTLNSHGTIAFCVRTLRRTALFSLQVLMCAHAVVCSTFPVFLV